MPPGSVHLLVGSTGGQREGGGRMGVEGGSVLIPSRAQILENTCTLNSIPRVMNLKGKTSNLILPCSSEKLTHQVLISRYL